MKVSILLVLKLLLREARLSALMLLFCSAANVSLAQSTDISSPYPIRTNEVVGTIAARDLGDSRLTNHFYAFTGTPGDVLVTVKSNNLNGDIDLFTAGSLRPLMKFSLYAEGSSPVTRAVYLRKREALILRVEARSPNDDEGIYQIGIGGSFEPIAAEAFVADAQNVAPDSSAPAAASQGKSRRVSSVGARIAKPPPAQEEVAAAPTPQPTPEDLAIPTATPKPPVETATPGPAPRRARGRDPGGRRRPASQPAKKDVPAVAETANEEKVAEVSKSEDNSAPVGRRAERRGALNRSAEDAPAPEPQIGPRLVIEMRDGTRIERLMSTIRRVTVENNQIVVVRKDGKIERTLMFEVLRMAIEP